LSTKSPKHFKSLIGAEHRSRQPPKVKSKLRELDPQFKRERLNYRDALPSREFILQILAEQGVPLSVETLMRSLGVGGHEAVLFDRRLRAMERDGQIMRNRKGAICVVDKLDLVKGTVQGHPDGFGFLIPDEGGPDLFLGPKEMQKVLHGDRVMAREIGVDRRGRPEASIVEVLTRANQRLVGRLHAEHGIQFVAAENKRISQDILLPRDESHAAKPGQVVMVEIIKQPSRHAQPIGRVIEVLGNYADPGMEIEIALRKHDLPHVFPPEAEKSAKHLPSEVLEKDYAGRKDLRGLPLVTIDGETAKDFDDAVYCEVQGKGFKLFVAIADVSHYVKPGDALDREALQRGNSVYFPRRVIPMLPEALSNDLCSLNPRVARLTMVCEMQIAADGEIGEYRFYRAAMLSQARLTYTAVAEMLEHPQGDTARSYDRLLPHINMLYTLYKVLAKAREKRGAIDFETIETQMIFNEHGKIERIVPVKRNDAHRLIEECMLAANVCASDFLKSHGQRTLYRIHEGPTPEKLEALHGFLGEFGLHLGGGDNPHARDYARLLSTIRDRPDAQLLQTVMLRSLQQAMYSPDNVGHFGLAYESYTHFTSPIRRYPDLLVHRAIKAVLQGKTYNPGDWKQLGIHCSLTERRADEATRDVEAWLKCYYMQDKINECFDGTVSGVTGFGIFVALDDIYIEGLVHISDLGSDYFHFDAGKHLLLGERTGRKFRLGDRVRIKVVKVDLQSTKIDFVLEDATDASGKRSRQAKKAISLRAR
jgi:ribonuclease R